MFIQMVAIVEVSNVRSVSPIAIMVEERYAFLPAHALETVENAVAFIRHLRGGRKYYYGAVGFCLINEFADKFQFQGIELILRQIFRNETTLAYAHIRVVSFIVNLAGRQVAQQIQQS